MTSRERRAAPDTGPAYHVRRLVDHVPSMMAYWDRDLKCRFANRAYEQWFGVDPERLVGTSIRDLLGPELFKANEPYIRGALRGEPQTFERVVPGPGGVQRHSLANYVPDIVDGEVRGFIAHVTETTRLKETENALRREIAESARAYSLLRESETALREAQRLGQIGSWEWDSTPGVATWSDELFVIFGRDPRLGPPKPAEVRDLYTPQSWRDVSEASDRALKDGTPYVLELEYRRADGSTGWVEARSEVVRDARGAIRGLRGTVQEVSLRHQMEHTRVQLQVAEAASRNKTALLSRVSHELRTPLNGILGFAQLCSADATLPERHRRWAELIVYSGEHMLQLVNEVLDLAAAEAGQIPFKRAEVNLAALLRERMLQIAPAAETAGVTVEPLRCSTVLTIQGDATRLRQIVDNLLSNAVKYTPRGGRVSVSVVATASGVELRVADTGIGLTREQLHKLFVPFDRLGAERTSIAGTGLGLALTKTLVDQMGGTIAVTSEPAAGSTFVVTLPNRT
jgi:PAS domain S-box-containing protein